MAVTDEAKPRMEDEGEAEPSQRKEKMDVVVVYEGNRTTLKVKPTTGFQKIFDAIETKFGAQKGTFKFMFEGKRINGSDTPEDLGIEHEDQVDVFLEQLGGAPITASSPFTALVSILGSSVVPRW